MTDAKLEKVRAAAAKAVEELATLEAAEAAKAAQNAAEREERAREYSRDFLTRWHELANDVADDYENADTYDPDSMAFLEGLVQFATAREKRRHVLSEAQLAESVLGVPSNESMVPESRYYSLDVVGHIENIVRKEVTRRAASFAEELEAQREAHVNGGKG
ncbi:hypothetical protein [Streptomyces sp. NPDC057052]|uniref:hypothetical protein n=1 Tax=Streptomyces sp. NPDC057052 TaxID=3346010 RepID=UPI00362ACC73